MASRQLRLSVTIAHTVIAGRGRRLFRVVAMFAAAAFVIGAGSFTLSALKLTPEQRARSFMGAADGVLLPVDRHFAGAADLLAKGRGQVSADRYVTRLGPTIFVRGERREIGVETADWTSPVLRSRWQLLSGRFPIGPDEVALAAATARAADLRIAGVAHIGGLDTPARVVGVVQDPTALDTGQVLGSAAFDDAIARTDKETNSAVNVGYLLTGPASDVDAVVTAAVNAGLAAHTRAQVAGFQSRSLFRTQSLTVAAPSVLLVVVLSASAFVLRIRRASRQLAILMALGVRPGTLVRAARLAAAGTAVLGSVIGAGAASAANALAAPALGRAAGHEVGTATIGFRTIWLTLAIVVGSAVAAAWLPARVARTGVATFDGAAPQTAPHPRRTFASAGLLALAVEFASVTTSTTVGLAALGAAVLASLSLVPAALRLIVTMSSRAPVLARLAGGQVARNARRATAAGAVGVAALIMAIGCLTYDNTLRMIDRNASSGSTHAGAAAVSLRRVGTSSALVAGLREAAGDGAQVGALTKVSPVVVPRRTDFAAPLYEVVDPASQSQFSLDSAATPDDFEAIVGRRPSHREWRVLTSAGMLQLDGGQGRYTIRAQEMTPDASSPPPTETRSSAPNGHLRIGVGPAGPPRQVGPQIPIVTVPSDPVADRAHTNADFLVGPSFLTAHRLYPMTIYLYVWPQGHVDAGLGDRVRQVAERNGIAASEVIFRSGRLEPLPFDWRLVLTAAIVLLEIGIGLALLATSEDARPFYQSLFSLGFAGWRQRVLLSIQGAVIAIVAVLFGVPLGLLAGVTSVHIMGVAPSIGAFGVTGLLCVTAIVGAAVIGALRPGQRTIDELVV